MLWKGKRQSSNVEDRRGRMPKAVVGGDRIQKSAQGYVVPDSFTYGTSEQRKHWFYKGFKAGDLSEGDTFGAGQL